MIKTFYPNFRRQVIIKSSGQKIPLHYGGLGHEKKTILFHSIIFFLFNHLRGSSFMFLPVLYCNIENTVV